MSLNKRIHQFNHGCDRLLDHSRSLSVLLILLITTPLVLSINSTPHLVYTRCNIDTAGNYTPKSLFESNLNSLLSDMLLSSNSSSLYSNSLDSPDNTLHGFYYCRGDVTPDECRSCVQAAASRVVLECPTQKEATIWYEECTLRYFNVPEGEDMWISEQAPTRTTLSIPSHDLYVRRFFDSLIKEAAYINTDGNGSSSVSYFATRKTMVTSSVSLNGLVQCKPQMSESQCEWCLRTSVGVIPSCCGWRREWVMLFRPSCQVSYRYATVLPTNRASSSSLLIPDDGSFWTYLKYFLILAAGGVALSLVTIVSYYTLQKPLRIWLREVMPSTEHKSGSGSSHKHKQKGEELKEDAKPNSEASTTHHQGPCTVCKGVTECSTHKEVSCIICKIAGEIRTHQQLPPVVCPPLMPPHHGAGVMWVCAIPNVDQSSYWRTNQYC